MHAYFCCRQAKIEIPEWILTEFDGMFQRFLAAWADPPDDWKRACAVVLFGRDAKHNPFQEFSRRGRDFDLATRVRVKIEGDGNNETEAIYLVSDEQSVSEPTVRRAWKKCEAAVRTEPLDKQRRTLEQFDRWFVGDIPRFDDDKAP